MARPVAKAKHYIVGMKIIVGSTNKVKIEAVAESLALYDAFADAEVAGMAAISQVSEQPKTLEETIRGAKNRAEASYRSSPSVAYGFGIESGLMEVPYTKMGFMDFTCCAIYDGEEFHLGLSPAIEAPREIMAYIDQGMTFNEAFFKLGLTDNPNVGNAEGMLGILTGGRVTRKEYTKQAIIMAMVHLEN